MSSEHKIVDPSRTCHVGRSPAVTDRRSISHRSHAVATPMWNHLIVEIGTGTGTRTGTGISHARVTRSPTTKVTRRPVATPAWRVARRVLERGRRDDRRRGGRTDEGGGMLEREGKKTRRGVESNRGREGVEEKERFGEWSRIGGRRGATPPCRYTHGLKTGVPPLFAPSPRNPVATRSPLIRAGCCAVSGTLTQCTTDTETRTDTSR